MKKLLLIALICIPIVSASADTRSTKARIRHIRELVARQKTELNDTRIKLDLSLKEIGRAEDQIKAIAAERDQWRVYGEDQHNKLVTAQIQVAKGKAGLLRRDIIIGVMGLFIGIYLFLKFYMRLPI